jgi:hypothetical protein
VIGVDRRKPYPRQDDIQFYEDLLGPNYHHGAHCDARAGIEELAARITFTRRVFLDPCPSFRSMSRMTQAAFSKSVWPSKDCADENRMGFVVVLLEQSLDCSTARIVACSEPSGPRG